MCRLARLLIAAAAALTALTALTGVAGCNGADPQSIAGQARAGDQKGFVAGDGSVQQIPSATRGAALALTGTTLEGAALNVTEWRGSVVVVNVWGSWCGPCVEEAPQLQKAWAGYQSAGAPVLFVGLDFKEGPETALAFTRAYGITYPSLRYDNGVPALGLGGLAPAVPTTVVLDRTGRAAARVLGATTAATLTGLVDDVLAKG